MQPRVQEARERYRNSVWTCRPRLHCRNKLLSGPDPGRVCWLQLHLNFILNKEQSFTTVGLRTSLCVPSLGPSYYRACLHQYPPASFLSPFTLDV